MDERLASLNQSMNTDVTEAPSWGLDSMTEIPGLGEPLIVHTMMEPPFGTEGDPGLGQITGLATAESLLRRNPVGLGQFNTVPVKPLVPFLTAAYVLAQRILSMARSSTVFPMQKIHVARQAMHLVILLNDSVDKDDGLSVDEEEEAIELEDELRWFAKALKGPDRIYDIQLSGVLQSAYGRFFRPRSYFKKPSYVETDRLWSRLQAYDSRTPELLETCGDLGVLVSGTPHPTQHSLTKTTLRRASTQASTNTTSSRITLSIQTRRSTDSRVLEEVLHDGDLIGPGGYILDQPIHIIHARTTQVNPMRVIRKLGAGSYAIVYLAQEILPCSDGSSFLDIHEDSPPTTPASVGRYFAIKCLAKHAQDQDAQLLEATIHQSLPVHDNVATLWHTLETASYLLLVLEYVPGEDLFYFLEQWRDHEPMDGSPITPPTPSILASLPPEQLFSTQRLRLVASMFSQMCEAVAHCHRNGVFHRDVKPENFMVTDSRSFNPITGKHEMEALVKLTDFGLATRDTESGDMDCGSAPYMSFECHNNITPTYATAPADVWSLGIVLINMLYHANPWLTTAAGQCESFDYFLREPIPFFMNRFPGMTPAVAEFFTRSVFCLLDDNANLIPSYNYLPNKGRRISADEFGQWARDMHHRLGPSARRTPAFAFQQSQNTPSVPSQYSNALMVPSVSQPGTHRPTPSYRIRLSVPVYANAANYGTTDSSSDSGSNTGKQMNSSSKRRRRSLSPTQAAREHFELLSHTPPVPAVPGMYRGSVPVLVPQPLNQARAPPQSSRRSYVSSIASVSTATTSSSRFTQFSRWSLSNSNASVRSVSTAATSMSSGSWRTNASGGRKRLLPLPSNIKQMDGIPTILDELPPHILSHGPGTDHKKRQWASNQPNSPAPGSSFGLDTISEKPKKSAMKQPRVAPSSTFNQSRFFAGIMLGKPTENDKDVANQGASIPPPIMAGTLIGGLKGDEMGGNANSSNDATSNFTDGGQALEAERNEEVSESTKKPQKSRSWSGRWLRR